MRCTILHETEGRMRIRSAEGPMTLSEADVLEYYLRSLDGVIRVTVYDRTGDALILYAGDRGELVDFLARFSFTDEKAVALVPEHTGRELARAYEEKLWAAVMRRLLSRAFLPAKWRSAVTLWRARKPLAEGIRLALKNRIEVPVLDALAVSMAMARGDFDTAGSILFLLEVGDILDEWTRKKSVDDLARSLALNVEKVWRRRDGKEEQVSISRVSPGNLLVVRMGHLIPLDGVVTEGEGAVNQASMTGESLPVHKKEGSYVYTGTVVEEGEIVFRVDKAMGEGRYDRIITMIEESEKLKSATEARAAHLADALVPYHLAATALVFLLTRDPSKAMAMLMVDYSCALKLSIPIAVLSAMRDAGLSGITVKGGKALENVALADTIVFDKTGTLTRAVPRVEEVAAFDGQDPKEVLCLAACLEEHYPHSIASAVVAKAEELGLTHEEMHSRVEYVVAHGIASSVEGEKVVIGSYHFVFEDEGCEMTEEIRKAMEAMPDGYSRLYLARNGRLLGILGITDPVREEASVVIGALRDLGFSRIIMMTGDNEKTAAAIAEAAGLTEYHAEVLPEDKADLIRSLREQGRRVIMVGDGINDTPALSEADAGIAVSAGAAIAREIADIMITDDNLWGLVGLRKLGVALMRRIDTSYRSIMGLNSGLIVLGLTGALPPSTTALLHNASTVAISVRNTTKLPV